MPDLVISHTYRSAVAEKGVTGPLMAMIFKRLRWMRHLSQTPVDNISLIAYTKVIKILNRARLGRVITDILNESPISLLIAQRLFCDSTFDWVLQVMDLGASVAKFVMAVLGQKSI